LYLFLSELGGNQGQVRNRRQSHMSQFSTEDEDTRPNVRFVQPETESETEGPADVSAVAKSQEENSEKKKKHGRRRFAPFVYQS
jgi:hypothetical protein